MALKKSMKSVAKRKEKDKGWWAWMRQRGNDNLKANNQSRYGETRGCNALSNWQDAGWALERRNFRRMCWGTAEMKRLECDQEQEWANKRRRLLISEILIGNLIKDGYFSDLIECEWRLVLSWASAPKIITVGHGLCETASTENLLVPLNW